MAISLPERTGLLVIRAWLEADGEIRLRARITRTADISRHDEVSTVVTTREEVASVVRQWVDAFVAGGDGALTQR